MEGTTVPEISAATQLFSIDEVAKQLGVSTRYVRDLIREKRLGYVRVASNRKRVTRDDIDRFIAANRVKAVAP